MLGEVATAAWLLTSANSAEILVRAFVSRNESSHALEQSATWASGTEVVQASQRLQALNSVSMPSSWAANAFALLASVNRAPWRVHVAQAFSVYRRQRSIALLKSFDTCICASLQRKCSRLLDCSPRCSQRRQPLQVRYQSSVQQPTVLAPGAWRREALGAVGDALWYY